MRYRLLFGMVLVAFAFNAHAHQLTGSIDLELRVFPFNELFTEQRQGTHISIAAKPEYFHLFDDGRQQVAFKPFYRKDIEDSKRTHFDIRELSWLYLGDSHEVLIGVSKVFWGVAESRHLVDVINQTDLVEDIDEEEKLGQPMVSVAYFSDIGTFRLFMLPYFRERTFPGRHGRLRGPAVISNSDETYDSAAKEYHVDWALRYAHVFDVYDIGVSYFYGTSREARLIPTLKQNRVELVPHYDLIHQVSVDAQATIDAWLLKFEGIYQIRQGRDFFATVLGFEYTFYGIADSNIDVGVLSEFLFDDRPADAPATAFDKDIFVGSRIAWNDIADTELLLGMIVDLNDGTQLAQLEASRRFGQNWTLSLDVRLVVNADDDNLLFGLRDDDHAIITLSRYF